MNALHQLMAQNPDPQVVQTCATCLQALAKLQSTAFTQHSSQQSAIQGLLQGQQGAQQ